MSRPTQITYRVGYKYQLKHAYVHPLPTEFELGALEYENDFLWLGSAKLIINEGYAWDGPSGPTIDTKNFMRGSLVHDALYQLIRLGYLDKTGYRLAADKELYRICREDGMSWVRATLVYYAVRVFGGSAAQGTGGHSTKTAP